MMCSAPHYAKYVEDVLSKEIDCEILKEIKEIEAKKRLSKSKIYRIINTKFL